MNREQMIAWLMIEGWIPQQTSYWSGLLKDGQLLYMYREEDPRRGKTVVRPDFHWGAPVPEIQVPYSDLLDLEQLAQEAMHG